MTLGATLTAILVKCASDVDADWVKAVGFDGRKLAISFGGVTFSHVSV